MGFPGGSAGKESTCNVGNLSSIPGLGGHPGEGTAYPLQYSGLENSMDCMVHEVAKSWTRLGDFHCLSIRNIFWRRKWQPIPEPLPGKSHGQRILAGYSP